MSLTKEFMNGFINALQLSINDTIGSYWVSEKNCLITFAKNPEKIRNSQLGIFLKLVPGEWISSKSYSVPSPETYLTEDLKSFLLLTRFQEPLMKKLAETDARYRVFVEKIFGVSHASTWDIASVKECMNIIFEQIQKQKLTLREISERCGLTQVSLSRLKQGQDIRLSNLIRITDAIGMKLTLKL